MGAMTSHKSLASFTLSVAEPYEMCFVVEGSWHSWFLRGGESRTYTGSMTAGVSIDARLTFGETSCARRSSDGAGSSSARSSDTDDRL
jgi:hypothetical protein